MLFQYDKIIKPTTKSVLSNIYIISTAAVAVAYFIVFVLFSQLMKIFVYISLPLSTYTFANICAATTFQKIEWLQLKFSKREFYAGKRSLKKLFNFTNPQSPIKATKISQYKHTQTRNAQKSRDENVFRRKSRK